MNTYKKFCPNVYVALCEEKHEKGEEIIVTTRRGKENECIVHNLVGEMGGKFLYSITRSDGFNSQERAKNKVEKLETWASNADKRSAEWHEKSNEGRDFLRLAEPIKVGHHSEKRHRALIERNWNRIGNAVAESKKAEDYRSRTEYWEKMADKIDLSMPESLELFKFKVEQAKDYHSKMKSGEIERAHSYSLTYAKKEVNQLQKKLEIAILLWA